MCERERVKGEIAAEVLAISGVDSTVSEYGIVENLAGSWLDYALKCCNREDIPPALVAIVKETVMAAYNRFGDEGAKSSSVGGQSVTYDDLYAAIRQRLIDAGLRIFRL